MTDMINLTRIERHKLKKEIRKEARERLQTHIDAAEALKRKAEYNRTNRIFPTDHIIPIAEQIVETKKEFIERIEKSRIDAEKKVEIATNAMQYYLDNIDKVPEIWVNDFEAQYPMKAKWQGKLTKAFKEYILANGYAK